MNTRLLKTLCLAAIAAICLSTACAAQTEEEKPSSVSFTDQLGRTVTLDSLPGKIVSLSPTNTEILYALGIEDRIAGVTTFCDYPVEAADKPKVGGFSTPNIEAIVALSPDLVIAAPRHEKDIIPQLESKGLTVLGLNPQSFDSIMEAITLVGDVTGTEKKAEELTGEMESRINAVTGKVGSLSESKKPSVFYLTWHDPLKTSGTGTLADELIIKAGGRNLFSDISGIQSIDFEMLVARNPQVMIAGIGMGSGEDIPLTYLLEESRLKNTEAGKNGAIYGTDMDLSGRGGPRIVDGLEEFARCIHPEIFGNPGN